MCPMIVLVPATRRLPRWWHRCGVADQIRQSQQRIGRERAPAVRDDHERIESAKSVHPAGSENGHAIKAISAIIRGSMDLGWASVSPSVDFTNATTTFLADNAGNWPPRFTISGFTYDRFERPKGLAQAGYGTGPPSASG
jgi:hypothetical protein